MREASYNPLYHDDWAWSLAIKGATNKEIADAFGVDMRTIIRWAQTYDSFNTALNAGKQIADSKVERCLYMKATGFEITDTVETYDVKGDEPKVVRIQKNTKSVPPDTMAIMYWLNNRQRSSWSQKQEVQLSTKDDSSDVLIYLPAVKESGEDDE